MVSGLSTSRFAGLAIRQYIVCLCVCVCGGGGGAHES